MSLRVTGSLARERRSTRTAAEVALCVAAAPSSSDVTGKANRPSCSKRRRGGSDGCRDGSPCGCRPNLGLTADDPRVGEAPGLRKGDHRTGERTRSALPPRPGSVQSCDGHPRPAGAGGRDGRTHGVGGGGDRRATGPGVHVERRRPHDAEARDETWRMWVNDRLNHDVAPREDEAPKRRIAPPTLCANRSIRQATTTRDTRQQP